MSDIQQQVSKHWADSRTIRFNILAFLLAILTLVGENNHILKPFLKPEFYQIVVAILPVINIYLRSITKESVHGKNTEQNQVKQNQENNKEQDDETIRK